MSLLNLITALKGGSGSGNFGHSGRPGKRGGSAANFNVLLRQLDGVNMYMVDSRNDFLKSLMVGKGFDESPELVDKLPTSGSTIYRGVEDPRYVDEYKTGNAFHSGEGGMTLGSGNYFSSKKSVSDTYSSTNVIKGQLKYDARVVNLNDLKSVVAQNPDIAEAFGRDPAIIAVWMGYDAIAHPNGTTFNVLNRSAMLVER